jgi:hypothetical protein
MSDHHKQFISIRVRLLLTLLGVVICLQASSTWLHYTTQKKQLQQQLEYRVTLIRNSLKDKGSVHIKNLARRTKESIASFDFFGITQTLRQAVNIEPELDYAILMDVSGVAYVHTKYPKLQNQVLKGAQDQFAAAVNEQTIKEYRQGNTSILEFILPIQISTEPWGVLRLGISLKQLQQEIIRSKKEIDNTIHDMIVQMILNATLLSIIGIIIVSDV